MPSDTVRWLGMLPMHMFPTQTFEEWDALNYRFWVVAPEWEENE